MNFAAVRNWFAHSNRLRRNILLALVHFSLWVALTGTAAAQPAVKPPDDAGAKPAAVADGGIRKVGPDTYYLRDAKGNLILVPDLKFEDFERLLQLDRKLAQPNQPPQYSMQQVRVTGRVEKRRAELDAQFTILVRDEGWLRIPLGFPEAVLREPLKYAGPGELFIDFAEPEGYVAWVRASKDKTLQLTLAFAAEVLDTAGQQRLPLHVAKAATSQITLTVDTSNATAVRGDVSVKSLGDNRSELTLVGLDEKSELLWRSAGAAASLAPVLEVRSVQYVRVEGPERWTTEARLRVRSLSAPFDAFRVRLPAGARLLPAETSGYQITPVAGAEGAGQGNQGGLVTVKLERKTLAIEEVRLAAETQGAADPNAPQELAGFSVPEAAQQTGVVGISVEGDWRVRFTEGNNVRAVDDLPEPLRSVTLAGRYEFSRQPYSLRMQLTRRTNIVSVEPTYLVQVGANVVRLEARLKCQIRGAKAARVELDLAGWEPEIDAVEPADVVDLNNLDAAQTQPYVIPFRQPMLGEVELVIRAHRPLAGMLKEVDFTLPRPRANAVAPALVVVLPDDNVELRPVVAKIQGLTAESGAPPLKLPARQQQPLVYRDKAETTAPTFAAELVVHERQVSVEIENQVVFTSQQAQVEQRFRYRVAHSALEQVRFSLPPALVESTVVELLPERKQLATAAVAAARGNEGRSMVQAALPAPGKLGVCELLVRYTFPLTGLESGRRSVVAVPLVVPADEIPAEAKTSTLRLVVPELLACEVAPGKWKAVATALSTRPALAFTAAGAMDEVPLTLTPGQQREAGATIVEQAWLQTRLDLGRRQDRGVFRISTAERGLDVRLPAGINPSSLEVWRDRQKQRATLGADGRVHVEVPGEGPARPLLLEVRYATETAPPAAGRVDLEPPRVEQATWTKQSYSQVVLPADEHLLGQSGNIAPDLVWHWNGLLWDRTGKWNEEQLAAWIGVPSEPLPQGDNTYLFSAFGPLERLEIRTAERRNLILYTGGAVLLAGLALLYLPRLRHPASLLTGGVALATAAALWPAPALLAGQLSSVGLALVALALWLRWLMRRKGERRPAVHGRWDDSHATPSEEAAPHREGSSRTRTLAATLAIPLGATEPKS